jgi:uncharacterized membrane protein
MSLTATDPWRIALTLVAALGCGLIAGVFFVFSTFVMKALARLPPSQGIVAMQSINVTVINPWFMGAFFGTALACAVAMVGALPRWPQAQAMHTAFGAALYLLGSVGVTLLCNVPRNNALAALAPHEPESARRWADYLAGWTAWNHVRTAAALGAGGFLTVAAWP